MVTTGVVILGIAITAVAGWASYRSYRYAEIQRTAAKADNAASAAKLALDRVALSVRAVRAMYASDWVTPDQFVRFAKTLMGTEGIRSLEFDRKVVLADRANYESTLTGEEGKSLGIWQYGPDGKPQRAPDRPVYFVREAANAQAGTVPPTGFDVASVASRGALIRQSMSQSDLVASRPVGFDNNADEGVVLVVPTVDRTGSIVGVATGTITFQELATVAALASGAYGVRIAVDADAPPTESSAGASTGDVATTAPNKRVFNFGGETWTVTVPGSAGGNPLGAWLVVLVVGAGLATTAALVAYLIGLGKTQEITEARAQLLRMLDGLGPLAWLLTPDGTVIHANRAAGAELRRPEEQIVGQPFWDLPLSGDRDAEQERIRMAIGRAACGEDARFDMMISDDDDAQRVFDLWVRPLGNATGPPTNLVASAIDITGRHESEQTQRLLMRELDHRMKNTLQVIQAVIRRTARAQRSVDVFERSLLGRVGAMSRAHDLLAEERWLGAELNSVITQEVGSFDTGGAISVSGPRLRLNPRAALSIALVVHELGTNASKYGALSLPEGTVAVTWQVARSGSEPTIVLRWQELEGPVVSPPATKGFGSMLIESSIAYELEGQARLDYRRDGLVCVISMPLRMLRPFVDEQHGNAVG